MGLSTSISLCLSIYLSIYLCMQLSVCLPVFIYTDISLFHYDFIFLFAFCCFIFPSTDFSLSSFSVLEQQTLHSSSWVLHTHTPCTHARTHARTHTEGEREFALIRTHKYTYFFILFLVSCYFAEIGSTHAQRQSVPASHHSSLARDSSCSTAPPSGNG